MLRAKTQRAKGSKLIFYSSAFIIAAIIGISVSRNQWTVIGTCFLLALAVVIWPNPKILYFLLPLIAFYWLPIVPIGYGDTSYNITIADIAIGLLLMIVLSKLTIRKHPETLLELKPPYVLLLTVWATGIIGALASFASTGSIGSSMVSLLLYAKEWGLYSLLPLFAAIILKARDRYTLLKILLLATVVASIISFFSPQIGGRSTSLVYNPNVFGMISVIGINIALSIILQREQLEITRKGRILFLMAIAVNLVGLVGSASRTSAVAMGVSAIYIIIRVGVNVSWKKVIPVIFVVAILAFSIMQIQYSSLFRERLSGVVETGIDDPSILFRRDAARAGIYMALDRPIIGYGYGQVLEYSVEYAIRYGRRISAISTTDNQYVDLIIKTGILGLIFFFLAIILIWKRASKKRDSEYSSVISYIVKANVVAFLVSGFGMPSFSAPITSLYFWLIVSLMFVEENKEHV